MEKFKLKTMVKKMYDSVQITREESLFWNLPSSCEKSYILNGDSQITLDFTEY
jgi:hypothetical protein